MARRRGHTCRAVLSSVEVDLDLAHAPGADLDSEFDATCLDTGDRMAVSGWLYEATAIDSPDNIESLDGSRALHPVLHAALGDVSPPVAALIRDWSHRDAVTAMLDARLLRQALTSAEADRIRPEVSPVARRAYADWIRDYNEVERVANADKLAAVMTEWADTVLEETMATDESYRT